MNAVEKLQAAIDKLEALKAGSGPGVWSRGTSSIGSQFASESEFVATLVVLDEGLTDGDAELIVTLHRTIDAQLAILREAIRQGNDQLLFVFPFNAYDRSAVALADAILGEE